MSKYVIDASVAVKWLYDEIYRDEAKQFLNFNIDLLAPEILLLECANAIRKKVILKQITTNQADDGFALLLYLQNNYGLSLFPVEKLIQIAYVISKETNWHPVPDCLYLALANTEKIKLITADRKFYNKVSNSLYQQQIQWIEELPVILS